MKSRSSLALLAAVSWATLLCVAACSSAPKSSGERTVIMSADDEDIARSSARARSVLLSESDDARVGREAARAVAAEIGLIEDPELDAYVQGLGRKLVRGAPQRPFGYRFAIVDQVEPNAFALPGGYVFISRGLLALTNDEDELANVIGHEITHAAKRHAAIQQQLAQRQSPLLMPLLRAGKMAGYARDMERDADRGGQMLAAAAGYDPMGMSTFLGSLEQRERLLLGSSRGASFFDTHPSSGERAAVNAVRAGEIRWRRDPSLGDPRVSYLRHVDGLSLGERPEAGVFEGERFLHAELDFVLRFPGGWKTSNSNAAVGAQAPRGDAIVFLEADLPPGVPEEMAEKFLAENREQYALRVRDSRPVKIGRLDAWRLELEVRSPEGQLVAWMVFVPYREATWRITGVSPAFVGDRYERAILNTMRSFRPLTAEERGSIRATRLRVVKARPGEDVAGLSRRTDNSWEAAQTAIANGVLPGHTFEGGELVKIARTEPWTPGSVPAASGARPLRPALAYHARDPGAHGE